MALLRDVMVRVKDQIQYHKQQLDIAKKLKKVLPLLEVGSLYEMDTDYGLVVVRFSGFEIDGVNGGGTEYINVALLAYKDEIVPVHLELFELFDIKPIDVSDLPLYVSWKTTDLFKELLQ